MDFIILIFGILNLASCVLARRRRNNCSYVDQQNVTLTRRCDHGCCGETLSTVCCDEEEEKASFYVGLAGATAVTLVLILAFICCSVDKYRSIVCKNTSKVQPETSRVRNTTRNSRNTNRQSRRTAAVPETGRNNSQLRNGTSLTRLGSSRGQNSYNLPRLSRRFETSPPDPPPYYIVPRRHGDRFPGNQTSQLSLPEEPPHYDQLPALPQQSESDRDRSSQVLSPPPAYTEVQPVSQTDGRTTEPPPPYQMIV